MNIGLFFGSFNPVHSGHLIIANHILNTNDINNIWFILSPQNPFKTSSSLLDAQARFKLLELATNDDQRFQAKDIEFRLPKPSFTINTLLWVEEHFPGNNFSIIMGSDSFHTIDKWKDAEMIVSNYRMLVYQRPGFEIKDKVKGDIDILNAPLLGISSTEIRKLIKEGKSIRYLVPEAVRMEIAEKGYYKE